MPTTTTAPTPAADEDSHGERQAVRFLQSQASVAVTTNDDAALSHAAETLYAYRTDSVANATWHVHIEVTGPLDLDPGDKSVPIEIGPGIHARALHRNHESRYIVAEPPAIIAIDWPGRVITARCGSSAASRHFTVRLIRQAMTAQLLDAGALYAHTAALTLRGRGILVSGHRRHGKTTTLVALLRHYPGDFVTNDRLLLTAGSGGQITGVPWPSHLRAGIGTLLAYPDLADLVSERLRGMPSEQRWTHREKVSIAPADFRRLISDGSVATECHPQLMIWPDVSARHRTARAEPVGPDEVQHILTSTRLFMLDPVHGISSRINHWLFPEPSADQQDARLAALTSNLARTVRCYRLRAGADPGILARAVSELP